MEREEIVEVVGKMGKEIEKQFNYTQTAEIGKLALALSKAQGKIQGAVKDSENPYFKSSYADLQSVWDACREALSQNELAVIQTTHPDDTRVIVITTLVHSSGEWIRGTLVLTPLKNDPQGFGSALTYARRYALSAIVGVAPMDDDGEEAMGRQKLQNSSLSYGVASPNTSIFVQPQKPLREENRGQKRGEDKVGRSTKSVNYKFLEEMEKLKEQVGEGLYYTTLEKAGYKKSNEITDRKHQEQVYTELKKIVEQIQQAEKQEKTLQEELKEEGEETEKEREARVNLISQIEEAREELKMEEEIYLTILTNLEVEEWAMDVCPINKLQEVLDYFEMLKEERENV